MNQREKRIKGQSDSAGDTAAVTGRFSKGVQEFVDRVADTSGAVEHAVRERAEQTADAALRSERAAAETMSDSARRARIFLRR